MSDREDVLTSFNFEIRIDGFISGHFTELSGLGSESEVIEHKVMSDGVKESLTYKIPGRLSRGDITIKRGVTSNLDFWKWRQMVVDGDINGARQNGSIFMYDQKKTIVAQWNFVNAWPAKIDGLQFTAETNGYGVEELVLTHEGCARVIS
ncbi:MAG: phage tail protein [Chloroflexota bacterium]